LIKDENENEEIMNDGEFEAEMQALLQARNEKLAKNILNSNRNSNSNYKNDDNNNDDDHNINNNSDEINAMTASHKMYNRDGLLKCIEDLDNHLSFGETLVICNYQCDVMDENDDINREVRSIHIIPFNCLNNYYAIFHIFYINHHDCH